MCLPLLIVTLCLPAIFNQDWSMWTWTNFSSSCSLRYCSCLVKMMTWWYQNVNNHCAKSFANESYFRSNYMSYILRKWTKCTCAFEKYKTSYLIAWLHGHSVGDDQPSTSLSKASSMGWTKTISFFLHFLFTALFSHLAHPLKKSPKQKWECGQYY